MPASLHFGLSVISHWYWGWHYETVKLSLEHAWQQIYLLLSSGYEANWWSLSCSIKNSWCKFSCHYFNADLALPVYHIALLLYIHKTMSYYSTWFIGVRRLDGWAVQKKCDRSFFSCVINWRSRERFEAVIFCVNGLVGNQLKSNCFHFEREPCNTGSEVS